MSKQIQIKIDVKATLVDYNGLSEELAGDLVAEIECYPDVDEVHWEITND